MKNPLYCGFFLANIKSSKTNLFDYLFDMKYIITESSLENVIYSFLDDLFDLDNMNYSHPIERVELEGGKEYRDKNRAEFYRGDYFDDDICFRWYDCEYFVPGSPATEICPAVSLEVKYENILNAYFGDFWREPFRKWFIDNFEFPCKTVDN